MLSSFTARNAVLSLVLIAFGAFCCVDVAAQPGPNAVHITLLHLNDLYELMPASGTDVGGVARLTTLRKQLLAKNPNTYSFLAGDLFSPSALASVPVPAPSGPQYQGIQMVDSLNYVGLDYATFGNHETDVKVAYFKANMNKSNFTWLSANSQIQYNNLQPNALITSKPDASNNRTVKIGVFGLTMDSGNKTGVQTYFNSDYSINTIAPAQIQSLQSQGADIIVGLTHWDVYTDQTLASQNPSINIILGGHEHVNIEVNQDAKNLASIYKADANIRTVWVHDLWIDTTATKGTAAYYSHKSTLVTINSTFADDPATAAVVKSYVDPAFQSFAASGFNATQQVALLDRDVDVRRATLTINDTLIGSMFVDSIYQSAVIQLQSANMNVAVDFSLFNIGTLRLDDVLTKGTLLTEYDVLRIVPFVNTVQVAMADGTLVKYLLDLAWQQNANSPTAYSTSQFLAYTKNVTWTMNTDGTRNFAINGAPLSAGRNYTIAITDYMISCPAPYTKFCPSASPNDVFYVLKSNVGDPNTDPRLAFIRNLRATFPPNASPSGSTTGSNNSSSSSTGPYVPPPGQLGSASTLMHSWMTFAAAVIVAAQMMRMF